MQVERLSTQFDIGRLHLEFINIQHKYYGVTDYDQFSVTHSKEDDGNRLREVRSGIGSIALHLGPADFAIFNEEFKDLYLKEVWDEIGRWAEARLWKIGRTRFLKKSAKTCYSIHRDKFPRIHVPLVSNPQALFFIELPEGAFMEHHLPADGSAYVVDTTRRHTFMNGGHTDRVHLVMEPYPE